MTKWNLIINVGRCINCSNCVIAAKDEHVGNAFPGYAAPAASDGGDLVRIRRRVQGQAPMVEATYLPVMCNHCDDPPCKRVGAGAVRKRKDGIVIIDPVKARGRKDIVDACPYGAIIWNEAENVPQTWIFDAHLLDSGWPHPRCQQSCPTSVFETVKLNDAAMQAKACAEGLRVLEPDLGAKPRVWYRGLERWETCFIGGAVSAEANGRVDCVVGAKVILVHADKTVDETLTDGFGDFRFDGLAEGGGSYHVEVEHALGRASATCTLGESVYLGELRISRADTSVLDRAGAREAT